MQISTLHIWSSARHIFFPTSKPNGEPKIKIFIEIQEPVKSNQIQRVSNGSFNEKCLLLK